VSIDRPPRVSLVTVNHEGRDLLEAFLRSVAQQDFPADEIEVVVVDNGSTDGSRELVRERYPQAKLIVNETNVGFAPASNQGVGVAQGDYVALLNNDMRLARDWVSQMVRYLDDEPESVVCAGSLILNWDGSEIDFAGSAMAFNGVGFQLQAGEPSYALGRAPHRILFACGGAMMIKRSVFLESGGFDDSYFAYLEDVDLGWRLWLLGYEVGFCPGAVTYHVHNATSRRFGEHRKNVLIERNAVASMIKNYEDSTLAAALPAALLLAVKRVALRSGISRAEFEFVVPSTDAAPAPGIARSPIQRLISFAEATREFGPRFALQILRKKAARVVGGTSSAPFEAAPASTHPIELSAYATVIALEDLLEALPDLLEKRQLVQARRQRSDTEIFTILGTPFRAQPLPAPLSDEYQAALDRVVRLLGVRDRLEPRLPVR